MDIQGNVPDEARRRALDRLDSIVREEEIRVLLAVESGSRAWGFPSPDSDYDVRFIYARSRDWYLSIVPGRDVIERAIVDDMDVSGWDLKKALWLMCRGNATPIEWLASPIVYRSEPVAVAELRSFVAALQGRERLRSHYLSLGRRQLELADQGDGHVKLKRYFYALRPACALAWLRQRPAEPPPMSLFELMDGIELAPRVRAVVEELVEQKRNTVEFGCGPRIAELDEFIESEFRTARDRAAAGEMDGPPPLALADRVFRRIVDVSPDRA